MEHEVEEKKAIFFYGLLGKQTENENGAEKRREEVCLSHLEGGVWIRSEKE